MRVKKEAAIGILVAAILILVFTGIIVYQRRSGRNALALRIAELSPRGGPPQTIEDLRAAISAYEAQIEQHVRDAAQTGIYWKILATRLQDRGLHHEALEALEQALYYYPEDPSLHYQIGVSAGIAAKSAYAGQDQERYYGLSERGYLRAIELDPRYARPRYGIGVLYVFELNRPLEAVPHLLRYLEITTNDVDAMFVLARAYYMAQEYQPAVDIYDEIIRITKDADKRAEALNNKQFVLDALYG
ncbi:MAG: tetratricopeptide repeat protein [Treponema sp.]|jgi:tetratricopeptide (TPR) repeat protein|nr:tetratricopeptide repeat protein [Treponema sp.]